MKSMLSYPLMDWDIKPDAHKLAEEAAQRPEMTLETAWAHALYHALMAMARRQRGEASADFSVGAALWAAIQAREALWRIEQDGLLPLCDLDARADAIYEELEAFGRRAPEHFDGESHVFRF